MGTQHNQQCNHIINKGKDNARRCKNWFYINRFTNPETATCHAHGNVKESIIPALLNKEPESKENNTMDETLVCIFGHRDVAYNQEVMDQLMAKLKERYGKIAVLSGGCQGADRWGARAAHRNGVPFDIQYPHPDYANHYGNMAWAGNMEEAARNISYSFDASRQFHWSMNFKRNSDMAEMAKVFVVITTNRINALLAARRGGTTGMLKTLRDNGVEYVIKVNPDNGEITKVPLS